MKNLSKYLLPLLFLALLSNYNQSCVHDPILPPEPPLDTVFNNDTFLSYWYFPEGSWWVYKRTDTTADVYDTATVTRTYRAFKPRSRAFEKLYENLILDISHTSKIFLGISQNQEDNKILLLANGVSQLSCLPPSNSQFIHSTFFEWPLKLGSVNGSLTIVEDTGDISLNSLGLLKKSIEVSSKFSFSENRIHLWMTPNIGFTKFVFPDKTEWELTKYYINK